jgi:uncharacterized protein with NRDE domain
MATVDVNWEYEMQVRDQEIAKLKSEKEDFETIVRKYLKQRIADHREKAEIKLPNSNLKKIEDEVVEMIFNRLNIIKFLEFSYHDKIFWSYFQNTK